MALHPNSKTLASRVSAMEAAGLGVLPIGVPIAYDPLGR